MLKKYFKNKKELHPDSPFIIQSHKKEYGRVERKYNFGWTEETLIPDTGRNDMIGRNFDLAKLPIFVVIAVSLFSILLIKTAWLQIIKGDYYYAMAEGNRVRFERIEPKRGVIYDHTNRPLVRNKANFLLYFVPADLPNDQSAEDSIISAVNEILGGTNRDYIKEQLNQIKKYSLVSYQPLFIADNIEYEKAMKLYLESVNWPGVVLTNKIKREYLFVGNLLTDENGQKVLKNYNSLSHILGYTGMIDQDELSSFGQEYLPIDYIGKMGIEYFWENELKGSSGKKEIEVDALGKEKKIISSTPAQDGHNLVLGINLDEQLKLEEIMKKHLADLKLTKGVAIVMDPNNGEILAMVSLPSYDNNKFAAGISQKEYDQLINETDKPLFNRAVSGEFPSGSTIKPVMSAAALEERIISENTKISSVGGIKIGQWFFPDYLSGGHGLTDVRRAIAESINTFFYYIGGGYENFTGLGIDKIVKYFQLFGLGSQTGIDLAGEGSGLVPTPDWKEQAKGEKWYIGDTYHLAIGQGDLLVTPLQVAVYTSFFANGGKLYQPHFIRQILSSDDKIIKEVQAEPIRQNFINQKNIEIVREGMRQTVSAGSGRSLQALPVTSAGKTGTAQWSTKYMPHAWYTGFAPYANPEIVITVLVEQGGEGYQTALPIAKEFFQWYFGEYKKKN